MPGFRPGKVPANLVRKRFGGAVLAEVLEESVNDATKQVLTDRGLRSASQPKVEVTSVDEARDLEFNVELELLPDITPPDMSSLTLTRLKAEPSIETIDKALGDIARRARKLEPIAEDRGAADGDIVTADFRGSIDGVEFPGGAGTDIDIELGAAGFIPGFAEQLVGIRAGETRTIEVTFPADYGAPEVAGKPATFEVTAKALKQGIVPPIDDELGKTLGFEGLDEVRGLLALQVQREYDQLSRLRIKRQLLDALAERADFPVPPSMVDAEFGQIWQRIEADRKTGATDADDAGKDDETLKAEYRAIAERRVRLGLLLAEIGRANSITVSNEELGRAMRAEAARYQGQEQQVMEFFRKNPEAIEGLRGPIFEEKVVDFVLELAQVTEQTVTPEELAREPELPGGGVSATALSSETTAEPGQMAGEAG
jgi:trigger factor